MFRVCLSTDGCWTCLVPSAEFCSGFIDSHPGWTDVCSSTDADAVGSIAAGAYMHHEGRLCGHVVFSYE